MAGHTQETKVEHLSPAPAVAVIKSSFNPKVTDGLLNASIDFFKRKGCRVEVFEAPGAFELPLMAQTLAKTGRFEGVVCLGCVIKGDTAHFEFISLGTTIGLMQAQLETEVPITFGILTTYTQEQAEVRSSNDAENKGIEAASACYEAIAFQRKIKGLD